MYYYLEHNKTLKHNTGLVRYSDPYCIFKCNLNFFLSCFQMSDFEPNTDQRKINEFVMKASVQTPKVSRASQMFQHLRTLILVFHPMGGLS